MPYFDRQLAAWRTSWERLARSDEETKRAFLERIGVALGEEAGEAAVERGVIVLGPTGSARTAKPDGR